MEDLLQLNKQMCFSIYVLHREVMHRYRPLLDEMGLTYPQYITLMALWEQDGQTVNQLAEKLRLDNGTLTPLLKRLEGKQLLTRNRSKEDERVVRIFLTEQGKALKSQAACVPAELLKGLNLSLEDAILLKQLAEKVVSQSQGTRE